MSRRDLNKLYWAPLPVLVQPLPPVIPHNPLSVLYFLYAFFFPKVEEPIRCHGELQMNPGLGSSIVKVTLPHDMQTLWSMGFFGKGTLSRSEPSWFVRTSRRLGFETDKRLTPEEFTQVRRENRQKFKQERAHIEDLELERRKLLDLGETAEAGRLAEDIDRLNTANKRIMGTVDASGLPVFTRAEDEAILIDGQLPRLEYLQLMPVEAFFLSHTLGCLKIHGYEDSVQLFNVLTQQNPDFATEYAVYHHYRSLGWCVRSGVKFGVQFLLYRRGPPFSHAEFCIQVLPSNKEALQRPWSWEAAVARVVGSVKKTLVHCYVQVPEQSGDKPVIADVKQLDAYLQSFQIHEIVYRRWIPGRNRD